MNPYPDDKIKKFFHHRLKIIYPGAIYHITQRAPGREITFVDEDDKRFFLFLLKEIARKYQIKIFCFSLLENHLHLLLKITQSNLSQAMHNLFTRYALNYNKKYERKGHVFCGVYRASLCQDEAYLLAASFYIHLNSYKLGLTKDIYKYRWSSLSLYIEPKNPITFVNYKFILNLLDEDLNIAREKYKYLYTESASLKYKNIIHDPKAIHAFKDAFLNILKKQMDDKKFKYDKFLPEILVPYIKLEESIRNLIRNKRKRSKEHLKIKIYIIQQLKAQGYTYKEIADKLGISRVSLYKTLKLTKHIEEVSEK